jgi:hypothetical protein
VLGRRLSSGVHFSVELGYRIVALFVAGFVLYERDVSIGWDGFS